MEQESKRAHVTDVDRVERAVLALLSRADEQRPWAVEEVAREIGEPLATVDALARLYGAGLIHRHGEFVFASRAALRAIELAG